MALQFINKTPEAKLMQMLGSKQLKSDGWVAILFHLSDLLEEYKSEYQIKIAINLINDLLKSYDGSIFLFGDYSILVVCHRMEPIIKEKLTFQLRYLYMDDPLAYTETGQENPKFCNVYDVKHDWEEFFAMASHRMVMTTRKGQQSTVAERPEPRPHPQEDVPHQPVMSEAAPVIMSASSPHAPSEMSASHLAVIETHLRMADIQSAIRRQPVCAVLPDTKIRRVFDELYIHIASLRAMLKSEADFLSNRWLFKYITQMLDDRMLELLRSRPSRYLESPISINLNVETLLSERFVQFDSGITPANKVAIVLEVPVVDVFADMSAFLLARDEVQKLGYRICLDGLTTTSFTSINREKLGVDLIKMQWNADLAADLSGNASKQINQAVQLTGTNRLILCRCDNRSAIEYGQALGISLYQGRYLDSLLNPTSKIEN